MPLQIVRNDITNMCVDAIVNTANPSPIIGVGLDSQMHKKAGRGLLGARKQIGAIACGDAKVTPAFQLSANYVIHTVGPFWDDGTQGEIRKLASCYRRSLEEAADRKCESIAFPLISAGTHRFPKDVALETAIREISKFLSKSDMMVYLVICDRATYQLPKKWLDGVNSYIDDQYTDFDQAPQVSKEADRTFTETLLEWIQKKGLSESDVYKKANMDKNRFLKIRNNIDYWPSKKTAVALAIGLGLNLEETKEFIGCAGYTLSHSSKFDLIIEYYILKEKYNVVEINEVLFAFNEPMIGG